MWRKKPGDLEKHPPDHGEHIQNPKYPGVRLVIEPTTCTSNEGDDIYAFALHFLHHASARTLQIIVVIKKVNYIGSKINSTHVNNCGFKCNKKYNIIFLDNGHRRMAKTSHIMVFILKPQRSY